MVNASASIGILAADHQMRKLAGALGTRGFDIVALTGTDHGNLATEGGTDARADPAAVLLLRDNTLNLLCAHYGRARWPNIPFIAVMQTDAVTEHCALIHAGVDWALAPGSPAETILRVMEACLYREAGNRLYGKRGTHVYQEPAGAWTLSDDGWTLSYEERIRIYLNPRERAFVGCLFSTPAREASHAELLVALQEERSVRGRHTASYAKSPINLVHAESQMHALVARLRAKARKAGTELPLVCVYGSGYRWRAEPRPA